MYCRVCSNGPELVWMIHTGTEVCWNKNVISCDQSDNRLSFSVTFNWVSYWYRYNVHNTTNKENVSIYFQSVCARWQQQEQWNFASKTLLSQMPAVLNWGCQLTHVDWCKVVKVIWHTATSPLQTDGSVVFDLFSRFLHSSRQSVVRNIGTTWRIWLNLCFRWFTRVHNPNGKSVGSAGFAQLTAVSPCTLQWHPFPSKLPIPIGGSGPPSNTWFFEPIQAHNPNGILISSAVFAQMTSKCPYTLQGDAPPPKKKCLIWILI